MALDISYVARNVNIPEKFKEYAEERFEKISQLTEDAQRLEIKLAEQSSHTGGGGDVTVELTLYSPRNVVRAEASGDTKEVGFDRAFARLQERLRRLRERKKGNRRRPSVREITQDVPPVDSSTSLVDQVLQAREAEQAAEEEQRQLSEKGEAPVTIRQKVFQTDKLSIDDAIDNMELIGHDFYLFIDEATDRPSVAYRRHGWSYGVISLDDEVTESEEQVRSYRSNN